MSEQGLTRGELTSDVPLDSELKPGLRAPERRARRIPKLRGRAQEDAAMTTWRRWQDWVVVGLGVVLFVTPFVFGETAQTVAASTAYVMGVVIALAGVLNAAIRQAGGLELIPAVLAVILFVSP
jgi:SPW repeat